MKRFLVAFAIADLAALALLALTFYPPFRGLFPAHAMGMQTVDFLRVGCVVALLTLATAYGMRRRLDKLMTRLKDDLRASAATPPVPLPEVKTGGLCSVLGGFALMMGVITLVLAFVSHPEPRRLPFADTSPYMVWIREDNFLELASVAAWLVAVLCLATALVVERRWLKTKLVFYVPLILFCFVAMGEEASWGQRTFNVKTPETLVALNNQGELNLHNIGSTMFFANVFFLITLGFFVVLPRLLKRRPEWATYLRFVNAPVLHPFAGRIYWFGLLVWIIVGLRFGTLGFSPFSLWGYYTQMDDEIFEFFVAYSFLTFGALDLVYRFAEARLVAARGRKGAAVFEKRRGKANPSPVRRRV